MWDVNFRGISIKKWFYIFISFYWRSIKNAQQKGFLWFVSEIVACLSLNDLEWYKAVPGSALLFHSLTWSTFVCLGLFQSGLNTQPYKVDGLDEMDGCEISET